MVSPIGGDAALMSGLSIEEMKLSPNAKRAAAAVRAAHPSAVFTSGRRDVYGQARAMAHNVVQHGSRWLEIYKQREMVAKLQAWCQANLDKMASAKHVAGGFYNVLVTEFPGGLTMFPHCRGDAFDLAYPMLENGHPDEAAADAICQTLESLPAEMGLQQVLRRERGVLVIHAAFSHSAMV